MKILLIVPGSGDTFYCGNCFRDNLYAQALRNAGHDVSVMPLYLPLTGEFGKLDNTPLFFQATSYYVAQKLFKKGRMPTFFEKILSSKTALRLAASMSGTTSAKGMEEMTLSMINGDDKNFAKQVEKILDSNFALRMASRLSGTTSAKGMEQMTLSMIKGNDKNFAKQTKKIIHWIENHDCPDIIHLSTSMLIGIAKAIKNRVNIPIVCSLQDEEIWLNSLENHHALEAWEAIGENATYVDKFIASSEFYKSISFEKIPAIEEIDVVYSGVDIEKYKSSDYPKNPTIGFYYRMNYENGLDILTRSFIKLKTENSIPNLKLKIGGGYTRENKMFVQRMQMLLQPYANDVVWSKHYSLNEHATFYKDISLICAPLRFNDAFGLYLSEAFAAGRPAVVPNTGSFSEIVGNAGLLYSPNTAEQLANALKEMLTNSFVYETCKENALRLSQEKYNETIISEKLSSVYSELLR
jgi:glycosyltransferase involved in cell wall biosynthesis